MGRPSNRAARRAQILAAFARVLATHGYAKATIAAVAAEAGVAPGLLHHHFAGKDELLSELFKSLVANFRERVQHYEQTAEPLAAYVDAAVALDARSNVAAARCWVGIFAEAVRDPGLFRQVRLLIDAEVSDLQERAQGRLSTQDAGGVLALLIGSLVLGAFTPRKVVGFAAPAGHRFIQALLGEH